MGAEIQVAVWVDLQDVFAQVVLWADSVAPVPLPLASRKYSAELWSRLPLYEQEKIRLSGVAARIRFLQQAPAVG
jgi:hypothetical protein